MTNKLDFKVYIRFYQKFCAFVEYIKGDQKYIPHLREKKREKKKAI